MKNHLWPYLKTYENKIKETIKNALEEDIGQGDITSQFIFLKNKVIRGKFVAKEKGIVAGLMVAQMVFKIIDNKISFKQYVNDGSIVKRNQTIAKVTGPIKSLLAAERTVLNFLQRMSGIATLTNQFVKKVKKTKTTILDTRKTAPGLRIIDKWAVYLGGGKNHRIGLYDMILIKDNHLKAAGSLKKAIKLVKKQSYKNGLKIEIEINTLTQLKEVLEGNVDIIMLDNMNLNQIKKSVTLVNKKIKLEISGGVNLNNIEKFAQSGVDYISIGALTHSSKALDISLEF